MTKLGIEIIGCGAIGSYIAIAIDRKLVVDLVAVFDVDSERAEELVKSSTTLSLG
ncbi:MAG: hypothetical protein QXY26_09545 [Ignisphaera sp.]